MSLQGIGRAAGDPAAEQPRLPLQTKTVMSKGAWPRESARTRMRHLPTWRDWPVHPGEGLGTRRWKEAPREGPAWRRINRCERTNERDHQKSDYVGQGRHSESLCVIGLQIIQGPSPRLPGKTQRANYLTPARPGLLTWLLARCEASRNRKLWALERVLLVLRRNASTCCPGLQ
jgi:hypothetical protein